MAAIPDDEQVSIDSGLIKVLASDTRRDVLRLLDERRMTLSEMSKRLGLKKATVLEHLRRLVDAGLIRRLDEEGRLWVYYELTGPGQRLVNPGHRRLFFLLGGSIAAVIVAVVVLAAFGPSLLSSSPSTPEPTLHVETTDQYAGSRFVDLDVRNANGDVKTYLVPDSEVAALSAGATHVRGVELGYDASAGWSAAGAAPPPGDYVVYARDASGADNLATLSELRLSPVTATIAPSTWWRGVDGDVAVALAGGLAPPSGTLGLAAGAANLTVPVTNGTASFSAASLDTLDVGFHALSFLPAGGVDWIALGTGLAVREAVVTLAPASVLEAQEANVTVLLPTPGRSGAPPVVAVDGAPVSTTAADGGMRFRLAPRSAGTATVAVGRLAPAALEIVPDLRVTYAANVLAVERTGAAAPQHTVFFQETVLGVTDADGRLAADLPDGVHALTVTSPDGVSVARPLRVENGSGAEAAPALKLHVVPIVTPGRISVSVQVQNLGSVAEKAQILAYAGTTLAGAPVVLVEAGATNSTEMGFATPTGGNATLGFASVARGYASEIQAVLAQVPPQPQTAGEASGRAPAGSGPLPFVEVRPPAGPAGGVADQRSTPSPAVLAIAALAAVAVVVRRRR